jgi:5-methylcytosine-specific restriction endonuclease McrA
MAKRVKLSKAFRTRIFERDNYECQKCFKNLISLESERVVDHKIPLSKGGGNSISNLWLLCLVCDRAKKDNLEEDLVAEYIKGKLKYLEKKQLVGKKSKGKNVRNNNKKNL